MVKAEKDEVNFDSLDLVKEEDGNISVGTFTGDLPIFSRQEALKILRIFTDVLKMLSGVHRCST